MNHKTVIAIPTRLSSKRLPNKPLIKIDGIRTMIEMVVDVAKKIDDADIVIACCDKEIEVMFENSEDVHCIMTDPLITSGTDRIHAAIEILETRRGQKYEYIVNLQGDLPNIKPRTITQTLDALKENTGFDIATPAFMQSTLKNQNIVKIAIASKKRDLSGRALYFSRADIPCNAKQFFEHIGVYCYLRDALEKFVNCPPSHLEAIESLEQLRALENNLSIYVQIVDDKPISVDTPEDLKGLCCDF